MFAVHCPRHGGTVLLGPRQVTAIRNLDDGVIAVELRCHDGEPLLLLTGARVSGRRPPHSTSDRAIPVR